MVRAILLTFILGVFPMASHAAERLPLLAQPISYELEFTPDFARATFAGRETIAVRIVYPTSHVVLHAAGLTFERVTIQSGETTLPATVTLDAADETATLRVARSLRPGPATIRIAYSGRLNRDLRGFYLGAAEGRPYAATQLEATDARRMFPSFDEPHLKATFSISTVIDRDHTAISNGRVVSDERVPDSDRHRLRFAKTPRMSTYLVALAIGDFTCTSASASARRGGTPLRVCDLSDEPSLRRFALSAADALLAWLNDYFEINYRFGKLDLVALPDFAAGAMENAGAIFFREALLLVDEESASLATRKRVATIIAHELAHQWFGNLVTMTWWDDLWLNEGFASWMETKAVAAWRPGWHLALEEVQANQAAMAIDALGTTRAVRQPVRTPAEIEESFDPIAYEKGAAVLRMLEAYAGEGWFRAAVNTYLHRYQYATASAEDFWTTLARSTGRPLDRIAASFLTQPGVPLVHVNVQWSGGRTRIELTQHRYASAAAAGAPGRDVRAGAERRWTIPVCLRVQGRNTPLCRLLDRGSATMYVERNVSWVVGNAGGHGYYRTAYDDATLTRLVRNVRRFPARERMVAAADLWAQVRIGRRDVGSFLNGAAALAGDDTPAVLEVVTAGLERVEEYLTNDHNRSAYHQWVAEILTPALPGVESSKPRAARSTAAARQRRLETRALLLHALGFAARDNEVLKDARGRVREYLEDDGEIEPALRTTLVNLAALAGDAELYEQYVVRSREGDTPEERYRFLYGLARFRDPALLRRTVDYAFSEHVRTQDVALLLGAVLDNPAGRGFAWAAIRERWPELHDRLAGFGGTTRLVGALSAFCDQTEAREIERFFEAHPAGQAKRTLAQTIERIETCSAMTRAQSPKLTAWVDDRPSS